MATKELRLNILNGIENCAKPSKLSRRRPKRSSGAGDSRCCASELTNPLTANPSFVYHSPQCLGGPTNGSRSLGSCGSMPKLIAKICKDMQRCGWHELRSSPDSPQPTASFVFQRQLNLATVPSTCFNGFESAVQNSEKAKTFLRGHVHDHRNHRRTDFCGRKV